MELTGLLRSSVGGDQLAGWPADMRVIARRTPRAPGEQAELGQDAHWRYGAFATNTATGQVQWLDARHRTQAHVEDKMKESKACGAERLPSKDYARNSAWLQLVTLAVSLLAWLRLIAPTVPTTQEGDTGRPVEPAPTRAPRAPGHACLVTTQRGARYRRRSSLTAPA